MHLTVLQKALIPPVSPPTHVDWYDDAALLSLISVWHVRKTFEHHLSNTETRFKTRRRLEHTPITYKNGPVLPGTKQQETIYADDRRCQAQTAEVSKASDQPSAKAVSDTDPRR